MFKNILKIFILTVIFVSCEDQFNPLDDNHRTYKNIYKDADFAEGVLLNAYTRLPTNSYSFNDVATDDAVTNDKNNAYLKAATGQWSAINDPFSQWENSYTAIMYLNKFLASVDSVEWSPLDEKINSLFIHRHKGEAYGLRALYYYYLLRSHAGFAGGTLMGVPIITQELKVSSGFGTQRGTFDDCMAQIYRDLDSAEIHLPLSFIDITIKSSIPAKYGDVTTTQYNRVFGDNFRQRVCGKIVKGIRSRAALLAASPAYNIGNDVKKWEDAAHFTAEVIDLMGGINGLDSKGNEWYLKASVDVLNLPKDIDAKEMLWRGSLFTAYWLEQNNMPPSLYGNGSVNPSQNLVEAFPMANGYPITHTSSGFVATKPYNSRDPRLAKNIIFNGSKMSGKTINIGAGDGKDAVDSISTSTRTGYYMKKFLREDVNLDPTLLTGQKHYFAHMRYTEFYLNYAEAANEAWGPDGKGGHNYSARNVIAAIRIRGGLTVVKDKYLPLVTSQDEMRSLIHNERRIELCFEGFRFWDLRRWKADLTIPVKGIKYINGVYEISTIEQRLFNDDKYYYGPIPSDDVLKFGLSQNNNW